MFIRIAAAVVLLAFVLAVWWGIRLANLNAQEGALLFGFVHDASDFYHESKRLPNSWEEFEQWSRLNHTTTPWKADDLRGRFALKWGEKITESDAQQKIFIALDPDFKAIEPEVNRRLYEQCVLVGKYQKR